MGVSIDAAVRFTKLSVYLAHTWPGSRINSKWQKIKWEIVWFVSAAMSVGLLVPLLVSMYKNRSSSLVVAQSACFVGAIFNFLVKMIAYRVERKRTKVKKIILWI